MTRHECEELILQKLMEIANIYEEYNPDGNYLSLSMYAKENHFSVNNDYFKEGVNRPINCAFIVSMDGIETIRSDEEW